MFHKEDLIKRLQKLLRFLLLDLRTKPAKIMFLFIADFKNKKLIKEY